MVNTYLVYAKPWFSHTLSFIKLDVVCVPVILALGRWRQDDPKFKVIFGDIESTRHSLGYMKSCLKTKPTKESYIHVILNIYSM